jgi:hypothetical protein
VYRYSILIHTGRGGSRGRVEPERRGEGQQFTKLGRKYQHDLQTINSAKHSAVYKFCKTPAAKSLYRSIFLDPGSQMHIFESLKNMIPQFSNWVSEADSVQHNIHAQKTINMIRIKSFNKLP